MRTSIPSSTACSRTRCGPRFPPLVFEGRGTARSAVEGLFGLSNAPPPCCAWSPSPANAGEDLSFPIADMRLELAEDGRPELDIVDEQERREAAVVEIDVHFEDRVVLLVEIGAAEALASVPFVDRVERRRRVEVVARVELDRRAFPVVGAIVEEDLEGGPPHA